MTKYAWAVALFAIPWAIALVPLQPLMLGYLEVAGAEALRSPGHGIEDSATATQRQGLGLNKQALGQNANPTGTAAKLYVTNSAGNSIHVIDLGSFKVIGEIPTGAHPHGAAVSNGGRWFYTTVESDQTLLVVDTASDRVVKSCPLSGLPNQCAATSDGSYVAVPIRGGDSVDIVDTVQGRVIKNLPVNVPHNCYNARRNDHIFVTSMGDQKVNVIDLESRNYIGEIPVGGVPRPIAVTHDEKTLYCALSDLHGFVIADIAQRKVVDKFELPRLPPGTEFPVAHTPTHGLELTPDERELWVTSCGTDIVYVFDTSGKRIVADVKVGRGPNWVTFSPDGRYCCVSNVLSDDVSIIDTATRKEVARPKVGSQPKRLVVASRGH